MTDYKRYLEEQLALSKRRDQLLQQMEEKLQQMKALAVTRADTLINDDDVQDLNRTFNRLRNEVGVLERKLAALGRPTDQFLH